MMAARKVRREVLAVLAEDASTGPELMQLVGVGEGQIREALAALKADGCVTCTAMTQEGWSAQFWLLAEGGR
jgi:DNA-binding PadR family transcriptional regulator